VLQTRLLSSFFPHFPKEGAGPDLGSPFFFYFFICSTPKAFAESWARLSTKDQPEIFSAPGGFKRGVTPPFKTPWGPGLLGPDCFVANRKKNGKAPKGKTHICGKKKPADLGSFPFDWPRKTTRRSLRAFPQHAERARTYYVSWTGDPSQVFPAKGLASLFFLARCSQRLFFKKGGGGGDFPPAAQGGCFGDL